jgi:hypothetical protein
MTVQSYMLQDTKAHCFNVTGCKMLISEELILRFQDLHVIFSMKMYS